MKIELLFPEVANLYGDLGNIRYLKQCCPDLEIVETPLFAKPAFLQEEIALVYMGSITERGQQLAVETLKPYLDELNAAIDHGQRFLMTGNALDIFGDTMIWDDTTRWDGLGLFHTEARYDKLHRYNALYLGTYTEEGFDTTIVGFKGQFGHSYGDVPPLFQTVRGAGLNPAQTGEGVHLHNFMATYVTGPLLVLNPPFTKHLLAQMGASIDALAFEDVAMEVYNHRVAEFSDPKTGVNYH